MRRISRPENYTTAKQAAAVLREIADRIEPSESMISLYVTINMATAEEVAASRRRADAKKPAGGVR